MTAPKHDVLLELADRIERGAATQQREALQEAWLLIHPEPPLGGAEDWLDWQRKREWFDRLLDAGGFESAGMSLLPKPPPSPFGDYWKVETYTENGVLAEHVRASAWVIGARRVYAATPSLALTAAALRSRAKGQDE